MTEVENKFGFPLFTLDHSTDYILKSEHIRISDIWSFGSYVIRKYKSKHKKANIDFLLSLLEQSKYFYETAEHAPLKSQPLLYYYSFLNFVKIVLNVNKYYGTSTDYFHGVELENMSSFNSSEIKIKGFLGDPTKISVDYQFLKLMGDEILPANLPFKLNIKKCLESCIGIHRTYCETFNIKESFYKIVSSHIYKNGKDLIFKGMLEPCSSQILKDLMVIGYSIESDDNGNSYIIDKSNMGHNSPNRMDYYDLTQKIRKKGIWYYTDGNEYCLYVKSKKYISLAPESVIYNLMFFFGSITRYHPYLFESLLSEKELWLISEFLRTQPSQFMYLVTSRIIGIMTLKSKECFSYRT